MNYRSSQLSSLRNIFLIAAAFAVAWVAPARTQYQPTAPKNYTDYYSQHIQNYKRPPTDVRQYTIDKYYYHNPNISPYLNLARHNRYGNNYYQRVLPEQQRRAGRERACAFQAGLHVSHPNWRRGECRPQTRIGTDPGLHRCRCSKVVREFVLQELLRPLVAILYGAQSHRHPDRELPVLLHACPLRHSAYAASKGSLRRLRIESGWCMIDSFLSHPMNPRRRNPQVINSRITGSIVVFTVLAVTSVTHAQFTDLVNRVPDRANTLIALNLQKALMSPLAQKEGWAADRQQAWESGMVVLPPDCDQFLMAAELDLEFMHPMWQVGLLNVSKTPSMPETAASYGGTIDNFGGRNAVALPQDTYIIQFGQNMVGAMSPANRQSVGRWLRQVDDNRGGRLSPYLRQAISYANRGSKTPIIMAMDLRDAISPEMVKQKGQVA